MSLGSPANKDVRTGIHRKLRSARLPPAPPQLPQAPRLRLSAGYLVHTPCTKHTYDDDDDDDNNNRAGTRIQDLFVNRQQPGVFYELYY